MTDPGRGARPAATKTKQRDRRGWWAAAGLIVLSLVPAIAGSVRIAALSGSPQVTPENARYVAVPLPVVLHIIAVIPFSILGALQFVPGFRRNRPGWHRITGRLLVCCGLVLGLTGLWMSIGVLYPRLVVAPVMLVELVLGFVAIRRRQIQRHRAWMIRAYALAMGAGTQVLTSVPWFLLVGAPEGPTRAGLLAAGWVINAVFAEWLIRRRRGHPSTRRERRPARGPVIVTAP
jgi:uncharacterized membrane protein